MNAKGVDVSAHQGYLINWRHLHDNNGVSFAILRASVGSNRDSTYAHNYQRAGEAAILRGAYHYMYPEYDAREQAELFAEQLLESELPAFLDVEQSGLTPTMVQDFLDRFEQITGRPAMIYTSQSKWHSMMGEETPWVGDRILWVAHYTDDPQPLMPDAWQGWTFWQHSSTGRLSGYANGTKDIDLDYFNGDEAALRSFTGRLGQPVGVVTDGFDYPCGKPDGSGYYVAAGLAEQGYFDQFGAWHTGEDWNGLGYGDTDLGDPVYAIAHGVVRAADFYSPSWGNTLLIEHCLPDGRTVWSQYAHLRERLAAEGDAVQRGDQIGTIGKGENDMWPAHLHFEIRYRDLAPDAWGHTRDQVLSWYAHPTEFIKANRPGFIGVDVTLDEEGAHFFKAESQYWRESNIGHQGHAYWTYTLSTKEDCWAEWRPNLPHTGLYEVMAYIPAANATSKRAPYLITHRRGQALAIIDQSRYFNQWVSLGRHPFSIDPAVPAVVRLSDLTGEPYTPSPATRKKIAFDAIRFVLVEKSD